MPIACAPILPSRTPRPPSGCRRRHLPNHPSPSPPPRITTQPADVTVSPGQTATFTVVAEGSGPLGYAWTRTPKDGLPSPIPGATGPSYTTPAVATSDQGTTYHVTVTNAQGGLTSRGAVLGLRGVLGALTWKRDIVYLGTREVAEIDKDGVHVTLTDHLGSPRLVVRADGTVLEQKFMPFGESLTDPATAKKIAKGFTNHEQTDASGLIYMQARFYLPMYHKFASPDPGMDQYFEDTQSWNIYSYVRNQPTMATDPDGMYFESLLDAASLVAGINNIRKWDKNTSGWSKTLDVAGVAWDGFALAMPIVPGGAGIARTAGKAVVKEAAEAVAKKAAKEGAEKLAKDGSKKATNKIDDVADNIEDYLGSGAK